ncbi:LysR family transcriptional regulator [Pseudoalteromonas denitrificans]|uniref:DNA-binding transcriptional regulator, LysR family n=1 Tax=Pseudoalteromonas denitrificans DSM 6059 TaxID=1123010 RepID=A0A1I1SRX4_9GAMM|nr:LysR family transcriptional regulator [Pseudoalteromonas denitrificans]SFD49259.1 DNA-binding transcriptional regulator, LysR family [Pseudoalteromonas denitrificans DSM 6059]
MKTNNKMDFELLKTFIAVVDNGSLTRAAGQVFRSQSAISMQIKRLESQLGNTLFIRDGKGLILSNDGKALVPYARRLLSLHDEALNSLKGNNTHTHIRIGCPDDYACKLLPILIKFLRKKLPKIKISVVTSNSNELRKRLDNGELDLTILTRSPNGNEGVLVYQDQGVWVCNNEDMLNKRPIVLALFESSCKFHSTVIDGLEKRNIKYDLLLETSNSNVLVELARTGQAVTVLSSRAAPTDVPIFEDPKGLPALPVAEIIVSFSGANQSFSGVSLQEIAQSLNGY